MRAQDIDPGNLRAIDVGTANTIMLRRDKSQPASTQPAAGAPNGPGAMNNPAAPKPASSATDRHDASGGRRATGRGHRADGQRNRQLRSATIDQPVGSTFTVNVNLTGGQNIFSVPLQITYNPRVLQVLNVSNGPCCRRTGRRRAW